METYTFTHTQLFDLLTGVIGLRDEYQHCRGCTGDEACGQAVLDTLEGLNAESELLDENNTPDTIYLQSKGITCSLERINASDILYVRAIDPEELAKTLPSREAREG